MSFTFPNSTRISVGRDQILNLIEILLDPLVLVFSQWAVAFWIEGHLTPKDVILSLIVFSLTFPGTTRLTMPAWRALRHKNTPYYIFAHGMMDPWFREKYPLKHFLKQVFWWTAEGRVLRDAVGVLFTCEEERVRASHVFRGHPYKEQVVLFGTSDPQGDPNKEKAAFVSAFPALRDKRYLLYLSRIHPKKGCDLLIRAFAECSAQLPINLDLVVAGPDQVGWIPELQALARKLEIADRIHWPGMLTGELKWGAFRSAEALEVIDIVDTVWK